MTLDDRPDWERQLSPEDHEILEDLSWVRELQDDEVAVRIAKIRVAVQYDAVTTWCCACNRSLPEVGPRCRPCHRRYLRNGRRDLVPRAVVGKGYCVCGTWCGGGSGSDRLKQGLCLACYKAWQRTGSGTERMDLGAFKQSRWSPP
jgi:hypothetical protein